MEDVLKKALPDAPEAPVAIESIAAPIPPDIVEPPDNNVRNAGIVLGVIILAYLFARLYEVTSKK